MPIVRIIFTNTASRKYVLHKLQDGLQEIIASELSTSDMKLSNDSVELIFEAGHPLNIGKALKILIDGNDFPERTSNVQERADNIAKRVGEMLLPSCGEPAFVYITLQAGGLGKFNF